MRQEAAEDTREAYMKEETQLRTNDAMEYTLTRHLHLKSWVLLNRLRGSSRSYILRACQPQVADKDAIKRTARRREEYPARDLGDKLR
jgi:hypothetical protein